MLRSNVNKPKNARTRLTRYFKAILALNKFTEIYRQKKVLSDFNRVLFKIYESSINSASKVDTTKEIVYDFNGSQLDHSKILMKLKSSVGRFRRFWRTYLEDTLFLTNNKSIYTKNTKRLVDQRKKQFAYCVALMGLRLKFKNIDVVKGYKVLESKFLLRLCEDVEKEMLLCYNEVKLSDLFKNNFPKKEVQFKEVYEERKKSLKSETIVDLPRAINEVNTNLKKINYKELLNKLSFGNNSEIPVSNDNNEKHSKSVEQQRRQLLREEMPLQINSKNKNASDKAVLQLEDKNSLSETKVKKEVKFGDNKLEVDLYDETEQEMMATGRFKDFSEKDLESNTKRSKSKRQRSFKKFLLLPEEPVEEQSFKIKQNSNESFARNKLSSKSHKNLQKYFNLQKSYRENETQTMNTKKVTVSRFLTNAEEASQTTEVQVNVVKEDRLRPYTEVNNSRFGENVEKNLQMLKCYEKVFSKFVEEELDSESEEELEEFNKRFEELKKLVM